MMTRRPDESESWIYGFSLSDRIPKDHLLRKIDRAIDFDFVYDLVEEFYSHTGSPSVDPVVVFKLSLIGYLYNIPSERRLLEEASLNLAYLWFLGYRIDQPLPDHSIMTKARNRFGPEVYRKFFHRVVKACAEAGLVDGDIAYLDSTLIDADGNLGDLRSKPLVDQLNASADGFVDQWFLEQAGKQAGPSNKTNQRLSHPRDPDADLARKGEDPVRFSYKGHIAVDGARSRIITSVKASGGAVPDEHWLISLVSEHEQVVGRPDYLVADQKYGSADNFRLLRAKGISPAIQPQVGGKKSPGFSKQDFHYDRTQDVFICPNNKILTRAAGLSGKQPYRSAKYDCRRCPMKPDCLPQGSRRTVIRTGNEDIISWAKDRLRTPRARELLKKRKVWPETIFAHGKMFHGMSRARFRGRWKVEIQLLMAATAMNLEKLARSGRSRVSGLVSLSDISPARSLWPGALRLLQAPANS